MFWDHASRISKCTKYANFSVESVEMLMHGTCCSYQEQRTFLDMPPDYEAKWSLENIIVSLGKSLFLVPPEVY